MSKFTQCGGCGGGRSHQRGRVENREERRNNCRGDVSGRAEGALTRDTAARDWKTKGQGGRRRSHCRGEIGKSRELMLKLQFHLQNKKVRKLRSREVVTCRITHRE